MRSMQAMKGCKATQSELPVHQRKRARDVLIARDVNIFGEIGTTGVAAAIWQRTPEASFQKWINGLETEQLPTLRVTVPVALAEEAVRNACRIAKTPDGPKRARFTSDVAALAAAFAQVLKIGEVRIRLDVSEETMCPKFHLDNVAARLLCTYRGLGTQYVPEDFLENPARMRLMSTGAAGLFRGTKWPTEERTALLHRSPNVTPGSGARLLLVIDPPG